MKGAEVDLSLGYHDTCSYLLPIASFAVWYLHVHVNAPSNQVLTS